MRLDRPALAPDADNGDWSVSGFEVSVFILHDPKAVVDRQQIDREHMKLSRIHASRNETFIEPAALVGGPQYSHVVSDLAVFVRHERTEYRL